MEIIVSSVIGGQLVPEVGMEEKLHQIIIEMRKSLKKQFVNKRSEERRVGKEC